MIGYYTTYRNTRSTPQVAPKGLLFDVSEPSTMTRPKDVSVKWSKTTIDVAKSSKYGVVVVYDNSFGAKGVLTECKSKVKEMVSTISGSWDVHTHCEWCGQKLDYVAVIVGLDANDSASVHHIGCDCVGKIFGTSWYGYRNADSAKKSLVEAARKRRRAEEYPKKFAKEIAWLDSLPDFLLKKSTFLADMKRIMRTGEREVSKKMVAFLESFMKRKDFDPKEFAHAKIENDKVMEKLRMILSLVESVDTNAELRSKPWSGYGFVRSVMDRFEQYNTPLSAKQMEGLNKVYVRYKEMSKKSLSPKMRGDANEIPW